MTGYLCSTWILIMNCYPSNVHISPLGGKFKIWNFFKQHWFLPDSLIFVIKYYFIPTLGLSPMSIYILLIWNEFFFWFDVSLIFHIFNHVWKMCSAWKYIGLLGKFWKYPNLLTQWSVALNFFTCENHPSKTSGRRGDQLLWMCY